MHFRIKIFEYEKSCRKVDGQMLGNAVLTKNHFVFQTYAFIRLMRRGRGGGGVNLERYVACARAYAVEDALPECPRRGTTEAAAHLHRVI